MKLAEITLNRRVTIFAILFLAVAYTLSFIEPSIEEAENTPEITEPPTNDLKILSPLVRTNIIYSTEPGHDETAYRLILSTYVMSKNSTPEEITVIITYPDGFKLTLKDTEYDDWGGSREGDGVFLYVVDVDYQITGTFIFTAKDGKNNVSETYDNIEWLSKNISVSPQWNDTIVADELSFDFTSPLPQELFFYALRLSYVGDSPDIWSYKAPGSVLPPVEYTGPQLSENEYEFFFILNDLYGNTVHVTTNFNIISP